MQTSRFEDEADFKLYTDKLKKKGDSFKLISSEVNSDGSVTAKIAMRYLNYETGDYLD